MRTFSMIVPTVGKTLQSIIVIFFSIFLDLILFAPAFPFFQYPGNSPASVRPEIWSLRRIIEWRPCNWWLQGRPVALPAKSNGYIQVDCYGGLNQMKRDWIWRCIWGRLFHPTNEQLYQSSKRVAWRESIKRTFSCWLIAFNQPGNQILRPALNAGPLVEDQTTSNPYEVFP